MYSYLLIDTLNLLHRLSTNEDKPSLLSEKTVFKDLVARYILSVESLQQQFLGEDGKVFLLFDTAPTKHDAKKSYKRGGGLRQHIFAKYKENRKPESKSFYNSLDLLRYYYLIQSDTYTSFTIPGLEADDLVKPIVEHLCDPAKQALLITNDSDWSRYLSDTVHWLPKFQCPPKTPDTFFQEHLYYPTEQSVILFKVLFGDSADMIPQIVRRTDSALQTFYDLPRDLQSFDALRHAASLGKKESIDNPLLAAMRENDRQARINFQLASSIPVEAKHINAVACRGRNSEVMIRAIRVSLGIEATQKKEFIFGNIKTGCV